MAEILTKCLQIKDYQGEEVNVILGTFSQKQVDAKIKDDVDPFTEAKIKKKDYFPMLILPLPKTVYCYPDEDNSTSYNHKNFNKWMAQLRPHLKLADEIDIIGFIRFTHMDIPTVCIVAFICPQFFLLTNRLIFISQEDSTIWAERPQIM